ncbi:MAG TPA: response regulator [Hyphomicrobiaceae bacterium]|nr:response regulator [Hyphomicrobiaceae bacterium]
MIKPRVLVVDDDPLSRKLVARRLEMLSADILEASDGAEAFARLNDSLVDLLIVDLEMPGMDGYDLLGCVRAVEALKHLPIVVLTGRDDRASLERALSAGATSYLLKPLNWTAFGRHIAHLLSVAAYMRVPHRREGRGRAAG